MEPQESRFSKGQTVVLRSTRELGRVESTELDGGEFWCRVRFERRFDHVPEDELDELDEVDTSIESLVLHGRWGPLQAFRTALAVERISQSNQSTVYSFRAQRILFEPYQYKPLLKVLESPDRRLLIADEVGLGKTIEAGLILTELEARSTLTKVLIVCPSRLRDKWREELNRKFEQDFEIYDKRGLEGYIARLRQNPARGRLRGIVSMQTLRNEELRQSLAAEVDRFDLVVVDEAHHARNPETMTSEMLRELGQLADAMLLLTATPLHLGSRDLHTLLFALRPADFRDPLVFEQELRHHRGVIEAGLLVRTHEQQSLRQAAALLDGVFILGVAPSERDPRVGPLIDELRSRPPLDHRGWVDLERRVQELHPLATVLTRTRKRDVKEHAPLRRAFVLKCRWTAEEDEAYQRLVAGSASRGWIREHLSLGQVQRARQAASCLPAALVAISGAPVTSDDEATEQSDILPSDCASSSARPNPVGGLPISAASHPAHDSKYEQLRTILTQISAKEPEAKVLIFTFFKGTARYLEERLTQDAWPALRIDGDVPSTPLQPERDERGRRMRQFHDDPQVRALVSTEVGSEGLDFQFCHHLVNYDLPWNPMVVEQRIGRIDRFGQRSEVVYIHNLVVEGTVEDRILYRLYDRIGIFKESIGELEAILGETMTELQRDYISGRLTPEEADRRVELAVRAIEQNRRDLEELESRASELFGHEDYIRDEMRRVGRLGRYISEQSLLAVLRTYLQARHPNAKMWDVRPGVYALRVTDNLRHEVQDASRSPLPPLRAKDGVLLFTTDGEVAFDHPDVELLNALHPLIQAAVATVRSRLSDPVARVGRATLLVDEEEPDLSIGLYYIVIWIHAIEGIRRRHVLEPVVWHADNSAILDSELGERLLYLTTEHGVEWSSAEHDHPVPRLVWDQLQSEARRRNRELKTRELQENEALYLRRKRVVDAECAHQRDSIEGRLRTARAKGRPDRILKLFEAQLEHAEARHRERLRELDQGRTVSTRLSDPLTACLIDVRRQRAT